MFGIFTSLLPLAIVGGLIYLVVRGLRRKDAAAFEASNGESARRLFGYVMVFVALMVGAIGLAGLLGRVFATADARSDSGLAVTISLTLVGLPVFVALARWSWRRLVAEPAERAALGWTLYLNTALITSVAVAAGTLVGLIVGLVDGSGYDGELLGTFIVWAGVWLTHWYAWQVMTPTRGTNFHLVVGSGIGLSMLALGAGFALTDLGHLGFDSFGEVAVSRANDEMVASVVVAAVGAALWSWHWLAHAVKLPRSALWLAYVLLFGVLGGVVATLTGAGRSIFIVLEWLFGDPETTVALDHYRQLSPALAAVAVGLGVWRYHARVVGPNEGRPRTDVDRVYDTIVAGVSLATVAASIAILVVALFRLVAPAAAGSIDEGGDVLLAAITLLLVGAPVWALTWIRMQRCARRGPEEQASTARRTYLITVLGISGAIAFGALIRLLIVMFEHWLGERSGSLNEPLQWPVALLVTTGAIAWYHFVVARAERAVRGEARPDRDVLLVWNGNGQSGEIAAATHARIRVLHRTDQPDSAIDVAAVSAAIDAADGSHLIVVAGPEGILVVPYESA